MPRARRLRASAGGLVVAALLAGLVYLFWPSSLGGCSTLTIVSGHSMEPTYFTGDLVWSRCGEPAVGDVVVYSPPETDGSHVIHRIIGGNGTDGWILQGDNNDFVDPWTPDNSRIVGIAAVHIPNLGTIMHSLGSPYIWISVLVLAAAILLWPRAEEPEVDAESVDAEPADPDPESGTAPAATSPPVPAEEDPSVRTDTEGVLP